MKKYNGSFDMTDEERAEVLKFLLPTPFKSDALVNPMLREARRKLAAKKSPSKNVRCTQCGK